MHRVAPTVFYWGFNIVKPLMTKHTLSKINIFDEDEEKWMPAIYDSLPIDAIPPQFGGTAELKPLFPVEQLTDEIDIMGCENN